MIKNPPDFVVVDDVSAARRPPEGIVGESHLWVYHGHGHRVGEMPDLVSSYWLGDEKKSPIVVTRSGSFVPEVFSPGVHELVVSENIKSRLEPVIRAESQEVLFEKLIDYFVEKGDMSHETAWDIEYPWDVKRLWRPIDDLPDVPELHERIPRYYELVLPHTESMANEDHVPGAYRDITVTFTPAKVGERQRVVRIAPELLRAFPQFRWKAGHVIRWDVFQVLSDALDRDFYRVVECSF